ncbi:drug/metabolite transporter superfamily [Rhizopogon salebrosus TDB-379]|nr:drug/metabolite transporter superfamily [Rhizopogon salebrosus TDB-379]
MLQERETQRTSKMTSSESPLTRDIERDYGSIAPVSTIRRRDGTIADDSKKPSDRGIIANNVGMLLIISSHFFAASMNISVKMLNHLDPPVHALEVIVVRMGITFTGCVIYMFIKRIPDPIIGPKGVRTLLAVRGITGFFALSGFYWALQYLSVADATVLTFLTPLTTTVAGFILLKESYSVKQAVSAVCSLLGVILIARPPFLFGSLTVIPGGNDAAEASPTERLLAIGGCMVAVIGNTGAYTSIRAIGKRAHPMHVMTFFSLWCTVMASVGMILFNVPTVYPRSWTWTLLLIMVGIFGFVAQTLLTMGLQRETVSRGVTGMYAQAFFAVVLEGLFFGVIPSLLSVLGAAIIMSSALYVVLIKQNPA